MKICAYTGTAVTTAFYISITVASLIFVIPRRGETWPEHIFSKEETYIISLTVPTSSFGVAIDLVIPVLPIVAVMQLQLPTRRRVGVIAVFMTALL